MKNLSNFAAFWARAIILALFVSTLVFIPARADVAPPEPPPGVIISPGNEITQVRMVSEVVTLTLISSGDQVGKAKTEANFLMRNLGSNAEKIDVRFPLIFGEALYYTELYGIIKDFQVQVNGKPVSTSQVITKDESSGTDIPWATFSVGFPPGQDVRIAVTYTAQGFGYDPLLSFRYILETGAGWEDTIGAGDIIVCLPYEASPQNVVLDSSRGFEIVAGAPVFSGNEIRWHFENLEPTPNENFQVDLISPVFWRRVLTERQNTAKNPNDGEAWGRLGKAIKEVIREPKGYLREDDGAKQLYSEAVQSYEKAVTLLPNDALWHYGFADLLWSHYLFSVYFRGSQDYSELTRLSAELKTSLQLDPANQNVQDLATGISSQLPWALAHGAQGYDFLVLTATPTFAPETATDVVVVTPELSPTPLPVKQRLAAEKTNTPLPPLPAVTPVKTPASGIPFCGGTALLLPMLAGLLWFFSKRD
jgi:hypothetical protein